MESEFNIEDFFIFENKKPVLFTQFKIKMVATIIIVFALIFLAIRLFFWLPQKLSKTMDCPNCEGKGYWYGTRDREDCKACGGSGRILKR